VHGTCTVGGKCSSGRQIEEARGLVIPAVCHEAILIWGRGRLEAKAERFKRPAQLPQVITVSIFVDFWYMGLVSRHILRRPIMYSNSTNAVLLNAVRFIVRVINTVSGQ
jgi:hypothetical protein